MAIQIREVQSSKIWEQFIAQHCPGALFQSWLWGEVEKKRGVPIWRFGAYEGKNLIGVLQILKTRARRGTFLHIRHGPVLSQHNRSHWKATVEFLKELAHREGAWFVRVSPQVADTQEHRELFDSLGMKPAAIHSMDGEFCWVLDLVPSEEELLAHMRKTTRYEIRRAQKLGVRVEKSERTSDLRFFFELYRQTSKRHGFVPHQGIREEFETFAKVHRAVLFLGSHNGKVLGSAIILFYGHQAIYHHSASIPTNVPINYLTQWEAIREAKKRGAKVYNFWGIAPEDKLNHPWRGITLFKKGFGGREVKFIHGHDLPISPLYALSRSIEIARRVLKGY